MLEQVAEGLYTTSYELPMLPGVLFPTRMVVAKLGDGGLWVHSPVALSDELANEVSELGPVRYLVAPNSFHHVHLRRWHERFPEATVCIPSALLKKRKDLSFAARLDDAAGKALASAWQGAMQTFALDQVSTGEHVFVHQPSRALIVTDLVFNVRRHERWLTRQMFRLTGTYGKLAQSVAWRSIVQERAPFAASLRQVLSAGPQLLLPAHGEIVTDRVEEQLTTVLGRWLT